MMSMSPGPRSIAAGTIPGGIVVHVYDLQTGDRILERQLGPDLTGPDVYAAAEEDAETATDRTRQTFVVFYDGDTGRRMTPLDALERLA